MIILKFYTYSPIPYPWSLRNIKQKSQSWQKHEIVDIGIYDLLKPPYRHSEEKLKKWNLLETEGWKVVPDCPDIQREFNIIIDDLDNIEYSKELLRNYYDQEDPSHIPVIQGYYHDVKSFRDYILWLKREFDLIYKIAIGTVCKASNSKVVGQVARLARTGFPKAHIHAFGLKLNHLPLVSKYIDSYDSMSWTFPRGRGRPSAKNKAQKIEYFKEYLRTMPKYYRKKSMRLN